MLYVIEGRGPLGTSRSNKKSLRGRGGDVKENKSVHCSMITIYTNL